MSHASQIADRFRRRQIAGLLIVLAIILVIGIYRAGVAQVFPPGWWRIR